MWLRKLDLDPDPPLLLLRKRKRLQYGRRMWLRMRRLRKRLRKLDLDPHPSVLLRRRKRILLLTREHCLSHDNDGRRGAKRRRGAAACRTALRPFRF